MPASESVDLDKSFTETIAYARRVLEPRVVHESAWPPLAAAAFFAVCAIGFATAAILAPPIKLTIPVAAQAQVN